jgi:hypothetical protein
MYGSFGRETTKYTVIYDLFIHFWPTLLYSFLSLILAIRLQPFSCKPMRCYGKGSAFCCAVPGHPVNHAPAVSSLQVVCKITIALPVCARIGCLLRSPWSLC